MYLQPVLNCTTGIDTKIAKPPRFDSIEDSSISITMRVLVNISYFPKVSTDVPHRMRYLLLHRHRNSLKSAISFSSTFPFELFQAGQGSGFKFRI